MQHFRNIALLCLALACTTRARTLEIADGDRLVFVGNTFVERDIQHNYLETLLTGLLGDRQFTYRNLGWSGDNVLGHSRTVFEPLHRGVEILLRQIREQKPTVVFFGYGMNESFEGPAGLEAFIAGLGHLLDEVEKMGARAVIVSPIYHEKLPAPLPDPTAHNEQLELYVRELEKLAKHRELIFIDLFHPLEDLAREPVLNTENGIHPHGTGYWTIARIFARELGLAEPGWGIEIRAGEEPRHEALGTRIEGLTRTTEGLRFEATDAFLPLPTVPGESILDYPQRILRVEGLPAGRYFVKVGETLLGTPTARELARGFNTAPNYPRERTDLLRQTVGKKNEYFFHRWRPANETYIYLFRKHEQGNNAREIPMFDPLIEKEEEKITRLKKPQKQTFTIERVEGGR